MSDHTLPLSGGWIIIKRKLPTEISPPLLSMFYAMPDRLFPAGWHETRFPHIDDTSFRVSKEQLSLLWRYRMGGRMQQDDRATVRKLDEEGVALDQRVRIVTPDGEVYVEPYEWVPANNMEPFLEMVDGVHIKMHELGGLQAGAMDERVFYCQSRGMSRVETYKLLIGEIKKPNIIWLEVHPAYAEELL